MISLKISTQIALGTLSLKITTIFSRSNCLTLRGQNTAYLINPLFMDLLETLDHKRVRMDSETFPAYCAVATIKGCIEI